MSAHNIQLFSGSVEIPDDLRVVSLTVEDSLMELGANGAYANVGYVMNNPGGSNAAVYYDKISDQLRIVHTDFGGKENPNTVTIKNEDITLNVGGNVHASFFRGDGGLLSNLVSDLQSVTAVEANSDQMIILSNATALWANVGNVLVQGNVTSATGGFHGDGGWLTNVQTTFEETIVNGNTTSNIVEFHNALSLVTTGNVGIQNVAPLGDLSIGANVVFDDDATDILKVQGSINCQTITIGEWILGGGGSQGLQQITDTGNTTTITTEFNNTSTAFVTAAKAGIGIAAPSSDAMLHVDGHVRLGGAADTPDNENMFVRAAGALNIIANHSNTDNTTSNLVMKAGEINAASITLAGAVTDDTRQRIVFKTRETEALTIDQFGNANFVSNVVVGTGAKFIGDGSGLTGLVSDLQSVSVGGATTNQTIKFTNATEGANITSNLYVGSNLHLDDVTLAAASVTLQGVTTNGATTTDAITITDTTEATTTSTGALKVSGGIAAAKDIRAANVVVNRVGVGLTAGANPDPAHLVEVDGNVKATNVIANNLTLNNVSLTTLYSLDQVVNVNNTTSNIVVISNTTPSTTASTGCLQLSGGLGVDGNVCVSGDFINTNAGGWRLTHTHSTRPTVNGATVGGELTGGNGDVETGFLRLSGGGSTAGTGAPKSYIDICGASASADFANNITFGIKGSEKVRLTDWGALGIGTSSPRAKLDVFTGSTATAGLIIDRWPSGTYRSELYQESNGLAIKCGDGSNAPAEIMRLTSSACGIGTTSPSHALNVVATSGDAAVHIQAQGNAGDSILYFNGASANQRKCAIISSNVAPASYCKQDLHFCMETTNDLSDVDITDSKMVLTNAGKLGLGTGDPHGQLHIGPEDNNHIYLASANNSYGWKLDTVDEQGGSVPFRIIKRTGGNDSMVLTIKNQDGYVGINTSSPLAFLDVRGVNIQSSANGTVATAARFGSQDGMLHVSSVKTGFGAETLALQTTIDNKTMDYNITNGWNYGTDERHALCLQPYKGRVGVGYIDPGYKLAVNGSLYYSSGGLNGSDDRIKYNEQNVSNALALISQLKPQKYEKIMEFSNNPGTWIPTDEEWENVKADYKYGDEFGFIAQDVRKIPELSFLVHGEETRMVAETVSHEEYSNLATEEQVTFTRAYTYGSNTITQEEYSDLASVDREMYAPQYTKQTETETPLALNYQGLFVVAIGAIQELAAKNDALQAQLASVLARLDALENTTEQ